MPAPAVSIIMPAFNRERYLAESIESVLNQTFSDWELIVVDDGSSDSTPAIIERYRLRFPERVKPISQANSGVAAARNTGIKASTGELVAFIDSDDLWHSRKLERQVQSLREAGDVAFVYTGYEMIDPFGRLLLFGVPIIASDIGALSVVRPVLPYCLFQWGSVASAVSMPWGRWSRMMLSRSDSRIVLDRSEGHRRTGQDTYVGVNRRRRVDVDIDSFVKLGWSVIDTDERVSQDPCDASARAALISGPCGEEAWRAV